MNKSPKHSLINIGIGKDKTIRRYANFLKKIINPNVKILFENNSKIYGTLRK